MPQPTVQDYVDSEFPEIDPMELINQLKWPRNKVASALGVSLQAVNMWACRARVPGKQSRRLAAELIGKQIG